MKVVVAVLGSRPQQAYGFCGRKATLSNNCFSQQGPDGPHQATAYRSMARPVDKVLQSGYLFDPGSLQSHSQAFC